MARKTNKGVKRKGVIADSNKRNWRNKHVLKDKSIITLGNWPTEEEAIKWSIYYDKLLKEEGLI